MTPSMVIKSASPSKPFFASFSIVKSISALPDLIVDSSELRDIVPPGFPWLVRTKPDFSARIAGYSPYSPFVIEVP